jgi:DNA-binding MarR family transcriptional regulator
MRPLGLGAQQFLVLKQLQVLGETSQAELADALGLDRSNLATIASDLAGRGLLERTRDEHDRRRYTLRCSRAGENLLRRLADGVDLCPTPEADYK